MIRAQLRVSFRVISLSLVMALLLSTVHGQSIPAPTKPDDLLQEKLSLLSDLQGLAARAKQLEKPLARGIAEAEIGDAAWSLDRDLAKELLRDAYSLAFPEEAEQAKLRQRPVGVQPQMLTPLENARLASAVISMKDDLALDVLDELVIAANHSELDTGQGRTGFETSLFKKLAEKDEARVNLAAMQMKDPLRQIVALAAIDQWKSDKLMANAKLRSTKE